jgi:hypothetical protein
MSIRIGNGWEFSRICVDCDEKINDLTLEEAKKLLADLTKAITEYEEIEKSTAEYFANHKKENEEEMDWNELDALNQEMPRRQR